MQRKVKNKRPSSRNPWLDRIERPAFRLQAGWPRGNFSLQMGEFILEGLPAKRSGMTAGSSRRAIAFTAPPCSRRDSCSPCERGQILIIPDYLR